MTTDTAVAASPRIDVRPDYTHPGAEEAFLVFLRDVTVVFDGFKALDIHAWGVYSNELRVVIGPNGAGKTTLCDVISGKTRPATGDVFFDGENINRLTDTEIAQRGVGRKFQTPTVFSSLTVFQNMELALPEFKGLWSNLVRKTSAAQRQRIDHLLERIRLIDQRDTAARYLSHGQRQWLEIGMLILGNPKLLLVDEPAAGLTDMETALTADLLLELKDEHTIIVIEHDMEFVRRLGSWITVLNEGKVLADGTMDEVQKDPKVIEAYLGR